MKMFGNLTTDGLETPTDRLGGGMLLDSAVYPAKIKLAYVGKAQNSSAQSVTVHLDIDGKEIRETHWVINRSGENSYADKQDPKKKHPLPGFTMVDDLCLVATGMSLADQEMEEKVVALYDFDQRKDVPTNVPVLTGLLGKDVLVALVKQTVDKQKKNTAGVYENTGETRDENVADKFFHAGTRMTVAEARAGFTEATFIDKWAEKNTGVVRNKAKGASSNAGVPGRPAAGAAPAPKTSLFGA